MRLKIENVTDKTTKNSLRKDHNEIMKNSPKNERARRIKIEKSSKGN